MSETIRSFIALELPDDILSALGRVQEHLKSYGFRTKWVRPANIHITLKFLGDIDAGTIEAIASAMVSAAEGCAPISLAAKAIGVFPNIKRPRVLWAGLTGQVDVLIDLQRKLDDCLGHIGFAKERRSFKGHLTLGRFKARVNSTEIMRALGEFKDFETPSFMARELILFKSELRPSGAVYSKLEGISLEQKPK
jgi:2'-5' RNA ligase